MRLPIIGLLLMAFPLFAAETVEFKNDREGETYYSGSSDNRALQKALRQVDGTHISGAFQEIISSTPSQKLCSFDVNATLLQRLKERNRKFSEMKGAILHLRSQNEIDDVVAKILIEADETSSAYATLPGSGYRDDLFYPSQKTLEESLKVLKSFETKYKGTCFDEAYRGLYSEILRVDRHIKTRAFEAIYIEAYEKKVISKETYLKLEQARKTELEQRPLTLKAYYQKVSSLRRHFPLRDPNEKSNFVAGKVDKQKVSRRQRLMEAYSDIQIILMADLVKEFRLNLDAESAEIHITRRDQQVYIRPIDPMDRFRLAIKLLRVDMAKLALNTYFDGRAPGYMDLMTAAFETGLIPASELDEVAALEEIWNPKKTFWEKADVWIRMAGSVATIALPPPYGFIPALAIVVIEMTSGKKDDNTNDPTVLF